MVFLSETKCNAMKGEKLRLDLKFERGLGVPSEGNSGGLAMFWTKEVKMTINSFSMGHIDITIKDDTRWWRFTRFYGNSMVNRRRESWNLLERLSNISNLP